jgi:hypothetical protein
MKTFEVHSTVIDAPFERVFAFVATAEKLPEWTAAFQRVGGGKALMQSPNGTVDIALSVKASREQGTIDWFMTFPNGNVAKAYSRVVADGSDSCIYTFILTRPPVPLERIEGALEEQSQTLREELRNLRAILEYETVSGSN